MKICPDFFWVGDEGDAPPLAARAFWELCWGDDEEEGSGAGNCVGATKKKGAVRGNCVGATTTKGAVRGIVLGRRRGRAAFGGAGVLGIVFGTTKGTRRLWRRGELCLVLPEQPVLRGESTLV